MHGDFCVRAVMALERIPADIRADGGVARMSDPSMIKAIRKFHPAISPEPPSRDPLVQGLALFDVDVDC